MSVILVLYIDLESAINFNVIYLTLIYSISLDTRMIQIIYTRPYISFGDLSRYK